MTKPQTYLGRGHVDRLDRLVGALESQVDRLKRQSASPPAQELPWMRSCAPNGDGVASFDLTFYDLNTGRRIHPSAEAVRSARDQLGVFADAYERYEAKERTTLLSDQRPSSEGEK